MAVCAVPKPQPDGTVLLAIDPAVTDLSSCQYVIEEAGGSNAWRELGAMSIGDAQTIGAAMCLVWAVSWGFRALSRSISTSEGYQNE
jgi:hypothetical protein